MVGSDVVRSDSSEIGTYMKTNLRVALIPILSCLLPLVPAIGQTTNPDQAEPLKIDSATGMKNLRTKLKVVYPPKAKQLHIQGKVELELTVSPAGDVVSERAISGPPELRQAAINAFKSMKYQPFVRDGKPSVALVQASVVYTMDGDDMTAQDQHAAELFFPTHRKCEDLKHQHADNAISVCREALALSKNFSVGSQLESRTVAYNDLAQLLIESGNATEASLLGDEVVALVNNTDQNSQMFVTAYLTRALTRSATGNFEGSDADSNLVESSLRVLAAEEKDPVFIKMFRDELKDSLRFHAAVLDAEGDKKRAQTLQEEAAKL